MRKSKIIKIDGVGEVTVRELTLRDIAELKELAAGDLAGFVGEVARRAIGRDPEELYDCTPSDLEGLWGAFREVNGVFFKVAAAIGLDSLPEMIRDSLKDSLVSLPGPGTDQ